MDSGQTREPIHKNDHTQDEPGWTRTNINIECFKSLQNQSQHQLLRGRLGLHGGRTGWRSNKRPPASTSPAQDVDSVICLNKSLPKARTRYCQPRVKNIRFRNCFSTLLQTWSTDSPFWPNSRTRNKMALFSTSV